MTRVTIIAEAGVNHNGDLGLAERLIDAAAEAGADVVKFQTFSATRLAAASAEMAAYQKRNTGASERQVDMLKRLELDAPAHYKLKSRCEEKGIAFLSSPFDIPSAVFLCDKLGLDILKIPSGEITNGPYLLACARAARRLILSTGMAEMDEIALALDTIACGFLELADPAKIDEIRGLAATPAGGAALNGRVSVLHCTTEYPAPVETINLRAMETLARAFGLPVGLSDHSEGIAIPIAATAMGAVILEKHMTLDRTMSGPDHKASIEPDEFAAMVAGVRQVELALGSGVKTPFSIEIENRTIARKGLVAASDIAKGAIFTVENITAMRPGSGLSPMRYWEMLGRRASRAYAPGEQLLEGELS